MKTRILFSVVVLGVLAALVSGAVVAVFTDTSYTTGGVTSATTANLQVYICEPIGGEDVPVTPVPGCVGDDDGENGLLKDETIFEAVFDGLVTGSSTSDFKHWDVRLRNRGDVPWELTDVHYTATETLDPGLDCNFTPDASVTVLGVSGNQRNDNHLYGSSQRHLASKLHNDVRGLVFEIKDESDGVWEKVHVEPGEYEDMRIRVWLEPAAGNECQGNAWKVELSWTVAEH